MKYPLQKELEKDLQESVKLLGETHVVAHTERERMIAQKYYDAIQRINDICVNRNRF